MTFIDPDSEGALEANTIRLFESLGWEAADCYHETFGIGSTLGRETTEQVVLEWRLKAALQKLNPEMPPLALDIALDEITKDRSVLSPVRANQEVHKLLKDGIRVTYRTSDDNEAIETVKIIDWEHPANNDFFLASQFWISGEYGRKRADLIGFVNGIPLLFIELKTSHKSLKNAYDFNLSDYRTTIPQVFWYNGLIILSNGSKSRIGSITAGWEHFAEWKKINDEGEEGRVSLETMIRGVCEPGRFLDIVENFTLFEAKGEIAKLLAKNHQFLGVNKAISAAQQIKANQGKLGVFWHTQGSGKSYSMVFFSQKVLRKLSGNWTFLIVTDREDLDGQIYRNFASTGAVIEEEQRVRAQSAEHLKQLLNAEDHRYIFTLIQKFRLEEGEKQYPMLSDRSDIVVITDEAHRSQYDVFALNMRNALPNAAFIGFTGTPLIAGEELTKEVFGDYISIYNFKQSIDDGNTVPLYYENRIPELQLTNENLTSDIATIIDEAELDEDQEAKLEREFAREYHLITREDRLDKIAEDLVGHYTGRGVLAKAMVISIDKATTVWKEKQSGLIVDYVGIFRNLQKALAIYGTTRGGVAGESPIKDKIELFNQLCAAIAELTKFSKERGVDPVAIQEATGFDREKLKDDAVAAFVINDDTRRRYLQLAGNVDRLFKSLLPDMAANEFSPICRVFSVIAAKIRSDLPAADISEVMDEVSTLLDYSISTQGYVIKPSATTANYIDLSQIDFDALRAKFDKGRKATEAQKLRGTIAQKLVRMVHLNRTRIDFLQEFQKMIDEYNTGAANIETFFARLTAFARKLTDEEQRGIAEQLSEEELVIFDLLTKPEIKLTKAEEREVKKVAKQLLETLKREKLVLDWKKRQSTRAAVRYTIETVLDQLPRVYTPELYEQKCQSVYQHVFDSYQEQNKSLYVN